MGYQKTYLFFDLNTETLGFNRKKSESWNEYIKRIQDWDVFYKT